MKGGPYIYKHLDEIILATLDPKSKINKQETWTHIYTERKKIQGEKSWITTSTAQGKQGLPVASQRRDMNGLDGWFP